LEEQNLFEWHSKFKSSVTSGEDAECTDVYWHTKQMEMWVEWRNLSLQTKESVKVIACLEFNLGQFKAFWKTTSTCVKIAAKLEP